MCTENPASSSGIWAWLIPWGGIIPIKPSQLNHPKPWIPLSHPWLWVHTQNLPQETPQIFDTPSPAALGLPEQLHRLGWCRGMRDQQDQPNLGHLCLTRLPWVMRGKPELSLVCGLQPPWVVNFSISSRDLGEQKSLVIIKILGDLCFN